MRPGSTPCIFFAFCSYFLANPVDRNIRSSTQRKDVPMGNGNDSILEAYLFETNSLLEQLDSLVLAAEEKDSFSEEDVNTIFRIMHTIKGSSAMMEYSPGAREEENARSAWECRCPPCICILLPYGAQSPFWPAYDWPRRQDRRWCSAACRQDRISQLGTKESASFKNEDKTRRGSCTASEKHGDAVHSVNGISRARYCSAPRTRYRSPQGRCTRTSHRPPLTENGFSSSV